MKRISTLMAMALAAVGAVAAAQPAAAPADAMAKKEASVATSIYDIKVEPMALDKSTSPTLAPYKGKVMLIVNVASKCGNTPQYEQLEAYSKKYKEQGFVVLGFPSNQFKGQEPGTEAEILEFCKATYGVDFPLFAKIDVNGENRTDLYKFLAGPQSAFPGDITWNFEKFLIGRDGRIIARIAPKTKIDTADITAAIEKALAEPAK